MKRIRSVCFLLTVIVMFHSCSKVPITNRKQLKMLPESMMMSMALTSYNDFLSKNPPAPATDENTKMVKRVGNNISNAVTQFLNSINKSSRIKGYKWDYNLVNNPTVNAWCMPGGKVVVYSGILPYTVDETGLAVVMGHEIAHAVARHGNERMSQQLLVVMGGISLAVAMSEKPEQTQNLFLLSYGVGSTLGTLAYSRQHEYEADKMGTIFMALAGYDPAKSVDFWERMSKIGGGKLPEFLSTHPSDEKRVAELKKYLPTAQKYYKPS
jgi:predicted Zn-dependent protease